MSKLPLTQGHSGNSLIAWTPSEAICHATFLSHVYALVTELPEARYAINLCEDRYKFMVAFAAVIVKAQTNLLPQSQVADIINAVAEDYPDSYCITEKTLAGITIQQHLFAELGFAGKKHDVPEVEAGHVASIAFTSGSTGKPQPNKKLWGDLVTGTEMAAQRFKLNEKAYNIVATVPPQHMYSLETSILYPLLSGNAVFVGRPFYPADVHAAMASSSKPVILVTTPVHLRACLGADLQWPTPAFVISATAPLSIELARQTEQVMKATIKEIFGCTEVGSMASRNTTQTDIWEMYNGITLQQVSDKIRINGPHVHDEVIMNDVVELQSATRFKLICRNSDMVNIAGKRGSIMDLSIKLQQIEGVSEAVFYYPDSNSEICRLAAFVVANDVKEKTILEQLGKKIDPVFMPRPLYKVEALPYNATGKLTQMALKALYEEMKRR